MGLHLGDNQARNVPPTTAFMQMTRERLLAVHRASIRPGILLNFYHYSQDELDAPDSVSGFSQAGRCAAIDNFAAACR